MRRPTLPRPTSPLPALRRAHPDAVRGHRPGLRSRLRRTARADETEATTTGATTAGTGHVAFTDILRDVADDLLARPGRTLLTALDEPDGRLRTRVHTELVGFGERLQTDADLRARVDRRVGDVVAGVVDTYGAELVPVISQVIERWDGKEAADRIELHVGRDLQFIRINGTVVGGLAGLLIHTLGQLAL